MAGGTRLAGPDQAGPDRIGLDTHVVLALGRPAQGPAAPRVESPGRVMRMWEMLNGVGDELKLDTVPPETLARVRKLLQTVIEELQRSVSPPLADELRQLIGGGTEPSASEVRIQYSGLLGWLGGLVISMYSQLEEAKRELLLAEHLGGPVDPSWPAAGSGLGTARGTDRK